jgi:hypothetical protein
MIVRDVVCAARSKPGLDNLDALLELLRNLETSTFIGCVKQFIASRERPRVVYSDSGGDSVAIEQLRKDENLRGLYIYIFITFIKCNKIHQY